MGRASLKQIQGPRAGRDQIEISRPYGPGLIEAAAAGPVRGQVHLISRPYGPGLIEATPLWARKSRTPSISRPYGPGLIEARSLALTRQP